MTEQKRISLFVPRLEGGGAERAVLNLARGLAQNGQAVDLVLLKAEGPYLEDIAAEVRVVELGTRRALTGLPRLVRYLRRRRPDVLVAALDYGNIVALWARRLSGLPMRVVVLEQDSLARFAVPRFALTPRAMKTRTLFRLLRWTYSWADLVVACSQGIAGELMRQSVVPADMIRVVHNPVVTPELLAQTRETSGHPWLQRKETPVLIGVGRLVQQKDFATLIRAFELVRRRLACRLIVLGEGEARADLEALVESLGLDKHVDMPGFVRNPAAYVQEADVFVLSSRWEGFGNVLVEALAAGTPIVSTDCTAGPSEILDEGTYGRLVPVGDVERMSEGILDALTNPTDPTALRRRADEYRGLLFV